MNIHENARTTPASRYLLVKRIEAGWTMAQAAEAAGVSYKTASKWVQRHASEGRAGLRDRCSTAHRRPHALPRDWQDIVVYLRSFRQPARCIAGQLGLPRSTVSAVLARRGLGSRASLEPPRSPCRYERRHAGDLLHLDIKKLGRFRRPGHRVTGTRVDCRNLEAGWEFVHVAIDDFSRIAYVEILPDESGQSCVQFLERAYAWFATQGIKVTGLLTDNGTGYRSHRFREACVRCSLRHQRTRPYTPRTNGKAERFIQSLLREWAYARTYRNSVERARVLPLWLRFYNEERPHASLAYRPPISRRPSLNEEQRS